jgi:putative membrane-bound dehydrogenase-like protein
MAEQSMKTLFCVLLSFAMAVGAAENQLTSIGVAKVDITPDYPVRMQGYAVRKTEATNAAQRLWAKALAIGDKEPALFLTVDNCGIQATMVDELAQRLAKDGVKRERIALCSSHTHSAPAVAGFAPNLFVQDLPAEEKGRIERYTKELTDKLEQLARRALKDRKPGQLAWSVGEVNFAKNRRSQGGPVDHTLPVLRATDAQGKLRAIIANYACHCTTLGGDFNQFHGDWAGYAQDYIERNHPGAVGLMSIGCGADANPNPRGQIAHAQQHAEELAAEVKRLLDRTFVPLKNTLECRTKEIALPFQKHFTREQWEERAKRGGIVGYHAKKNLTRLDRDEALPTTLPYRVSMWNFGGDLAMVFLPGEVVIDYAVRLKKDFDASRLWITAYANDVPCYIPSKRILQEGGYEAEDSLWYYDRPARLAPETEDLIIKTVHELLPKQFVTDPKSAEFPPPRSPTEALAAFRMKADLEIELVACEPAIVDPVAIDWSADGRLWVVEMHDYPTGLDGNYKPGGRVKVLSDSDGDGKYEHSVLFLDGLPFPTGIMAWKKGVLVCAAPDIIYAEDTNGDGKADVVRTNLTGFATHNYQARVNGLTWGLDGWVYGASGLFGGKIKSLQTGQEVDLGGRDFRIKPDSGEIEPVAGLSQQSRVRDDWGNWFGCDNSTLLWHFPLAEHYVKRNPHVPAPEPRVYPVKGNDPNRLYPASRALERFNDPSHMNRTTSACGLEIYRDELLGANYAGNAFVCEPVHNLIHRLVLEPEGATFAARRAPEDQRSEFLASTDNWFRPVQVRTGPDGALWIVDMYRFVVEHPRWISTNRLAMLDVRAGSDKGRIYRIFPRDKKASPMRNIARLTTTQLVEAFDQPNGPMRDLIHRDLLARKDVSSDRLSAIATQGGHAAARGQALWILKQLGKTEPAALADADPRIRRQGIQLCNDWEQLHPLAAQRDLDARLALELALVAGNHEDSRAAQFLTKLIESGTKDKWLKAAIVSSALPHLPLLVRAVYKNEKADIDLAGKLVTTAVRLKDLDLTTVNTMLRAALPSEGGHRSERSLHLLSVLLDSEGALAEYAEISPIFGHARHAAPQGSSAAIALLGRQRDGLEKDVALLITLASEHPAAIERLRGMREPLVAKQVLGSWPLLSPALRQKLIDVLITREEWARQLRAALDQRVISMAEVPLPARKRLGIEETGAGARAEVIAKYKDVKSFTPATARGETLFANNCASCHAFRGLGHAVGPNLAEFAGKPIDDFVIAILDPNTAIEPKFVAYEVETKDGRSLHGVVRNETATSLSVAQANGLEEKVLRGDIKELRASTLSMMPEGLEQAMGPQDMANLIAWLKAGPGTNLQATASR